MEEGDYVRILDCSTINYKRGFHPGDMGVVTRIIRVNGEKKIYVEHSETEIVSEFIELFVEVE